ncbi:MAG TPA: SMC-Scp complex subunit ScpB, partial [Granulicella sp.]|nr:SMC-Scp complex subunit ScpB [Granulicella sp.]
MSLKAKIEAVIYASEEPVTLAQLAGLLGQEAQAELDHLESAQQSLALAETDEASAQASTAEAESERTAPAPLAEPDPTDTAPASEPEPTDASPLPEHPAQPAEAAAEKSARDQKLDEKLRERKLRDYFRSILDELMADYARESNDRGLEIREVASGFRLSTKPQYHDTVRGFVKSLKPPLKLSLQALETLAVVAYKQPVTAPEVSEIRGVDSGGVLGSLMARKLVTTAGRKQVIGRPILSKTTRDFLLRFGLKDIQELPSIEEFEKMAGELAET